MKLVNEYKFSTCYCTSPYGNHIFTFCLSLACCLLCFNCIKYKMSLACALVTECVYMTVLQWGKGYGLLDASLHTFAAFASYLLYMYIFLYNIEYIIQLAA